MHRLPKPMSFTLDEIKKLIEKCQLHSEREVVRGKKKLVNRYVCISELLCRLEDFGKQRKQGFTSLEK